MTTSLPDTSPSHRKIHGYYALPVPPETINNWCYAEFGIAVRIYITKTPAIFELYTDYLLTSFSIPQRQVGQYIHQQDVAHADEIRHVHKHSRYPYWMWAQVSGSFCFFMTHFSRGKQTAHQWLGEFSGYLVTDHYAGYSDYPPDKRQICWAHLIRHFINISHRRGQVGVIGKRLLLLNR